MANTLAALLKSGNNFITHCVIGQNRTILKSLASRYLYSATTLGIDGYVQQKDRTINQLSNIAPTFRDKMKEYTAVDSINMVFTEDLKNMLHLAENDEDVDLVIRMMKRFNKQNKQLRFGNYVFGPVVMRMFHVLNKYEEAIQCFKDPELEGFFDQLITYQVFLDLLYENNKYTDILEMFTIIKEKQIEGIKFAKNVIVLTFAACYKLNTVESLTFALKLWSELLVIGHLPMRRAITFCAGLALNQGKPDVALEILTSGRNPNYTTIRNIKVGALIAMGNIEEAIRVLKSVLNEDTATTGPVQTFNKDILDRVKEAVEKAGDSNYKLEFNRIEKYFKEQGHISENTLDEQLCGEIVLPPRVDQRDNRFVQRDPYQQRYGYDRPNKGRFVERFQRPGLNDLQ